MSAEVPRRRRAERPPEARLIDGRRVVLVRKQLPRPPTDDELKNPGKNLYDRLQALSSRIRRLSPSRIDPEAFHVERSSIAHDLQKVAEEIGRTTAGSR